NADLPASGLVAHRLLDRGGDPPVAVAGEVDAVGGEAEFGDGRFAESVEEVEVGAVAFFGDGLEGVAVEAEVAVVLRRGGKRRAELVPAGAEVAGLAPNGVAAVSEVSEGDGFVVEAGGELGFDVGFIQLAVEEVVADEGDPLAGADFDTGFIRSPRRQGERE